MNPFRRLVTVGHNARAFVSNRRPTEQEETVKQRSEGDMQRDAWYWGQARSNPPPECLWRLWRSHSAQTEIFFTDVFKYVCLSMRQNLLNCAKVGAFARGLSHLINGGDSCGYLRDRSSTAYLPISFGNQNRLSAIGYLCQNMSYGLTYLWQSRCVCLHINEVLEHSSSTSQRVWSLDTAQVVLAQVKLSLPGFCWPVIEHHAQLKSSILSRMSFLNMNEANFDTLQVVMNGTIPAQACLRNDKSATVAHVLVLDSALWIL